MNYLPRENLRLISIKGGHRPSVHTVAGIQTDGVLVFRNLCACLYRKRCELTLLHVSYRGSQRLQRQWQAICDNKASQLFFIDKLLWFVCH